MRIEINKHIVADSAICHGKPTFKGTRIMVWQGLEMLQGGTKIQERIEDFLSLTRQHIKAALQYSVSLTKGRDHAIISIPLEA